MSCKFYDISVVTIETEKMVMEIMSLMKLQSLHRRLLRATGADEHFNYIDAGFVEDAEFERRTLRDIIKPALRIMHKVMRLDKYIQSLV